MDMTRKPNKLSVVSIKEQRFEEIQAATVSDPCRTSSTKAAAAKAAEPWTIDNNTM